MARHQSHRARRVGSRHRVDMPIAAADQVARPPGRAEHAAHAMAEQQHGGEGGRPGQTARHSQAGQDQPRQDAQPDRPQAASPHPEQPLPERRPGPAGPDTVQFAVGVAKNLVPLQFLILLWASHARHARSPASVPMRTNHGCDAQSFTSRSPPSTGHRHTRVCREISSDVFSELFQMCGIFLTASCAAQAFSIMSCAFTRLTKIHHTHHQKKPHGFMPAEADGHGDSSCVFLTRISREIPHHLLRRGKKENDRDEYHRAQGKSGLARAAGHARHGRNPLAPRGGVF